MSSVFILFSGTVNVPTLRLECIFSLSWYHKKVESCQEWGEDTQWEEGEESWGQVKAMNKCDKQGNWDWTRGRKRMKCVHWVTTEYKENRMSGRPVQDPKHCKLLLLCGAAKPWGAGSAWLSSLGTAEGRKILADFGVLVLKSCWLSETPHNAQAEWHLYSVLASCLPNLCPFGCSYARRDVLPLGKFTVNLSGCPRNSAFTEHLYRLIQQLVPAVSIALGRALGGCVLTDSARQTVL